MRNISSLLPLTQEYNIIQKYFNSSPEKYFCKISYDTYTKFLNECLTNNKINLIQLLLEKEEAFNIAYKLLQNINTKDIHEYQISDKDAWFIDEYVNYSYLQLLEGVLLPYMQLAAYVELVNKGKGTDNLDLYTCINNINKGDLKYIESLYDHNLRNGIGHGKIVYHETKAEYIDKRGQVKVMYFYQFVRKLDELIDVLNGFTLAYITFILNNKHATGINLPRQAIFDEIKSRSSSDDWTLTSVVNQTILNKNQLAIIIESGCKSQSDLQDRIINTVTKSANLIKHSFDIIYLHITHNKFPGFIKFDVNKINNIDPLTATKQRYLDAAIDSLEWFLDGFSKDMPVSMDLKSFPKDLQFKGISIYKEEIINDFLFKDIQQHASTYNKYLLVKDANYVYIGDVANNENIINSIKDSLYKLIEHTKEKSIELTKIYNHRQMPLKYICISIFESDKRTRELRTTGIKPNRICTIQINTTNEVGNINLMDSKTEVYKGAFFNWNHYWRNNFEYDKMFPA
ncbi:hypothetical protein [Hymenobacter cavernae]|uniref:Uncharacterized protein n=1 Tax=Hymenobacter cavernae TaxID=2044852 RepID=A0ABQ1TSV1_9BACT|nr:hypothetical protein [Hymenobacter cavernae]GGF01712.1 hypothetical protein GCM10011383_10760 [Hymenobacter cavernae]